MKERKHISYVKKIRVAELRDLNRLRKDTMIVKIRYLTRSHEWELIKRV